MASSEARNVEDPVNGGILAVSLVSTLLGLGLLASGNPLGVVALLFGAAGFIHLKGGLYELITFTEQEPQQTDESDDALTVIRNRYARGEIDQAEFERRLDDLVETETREDTVKYRDTDVVTERS